ncbi:MAG: hypothetical protein KGM43_03885, partial [Planctomycetota bacterium]|nr:hypothetical protein [Planctomycetota bacterium]
PDGSSRGAQRTATIRRTLSRGRVGRAGGLVPTANAAVDSVVSGGQIEARGAPGKQPPDALRGLQWS